MRSSDRQKVCSGCSGRIPYNAKECIYCGAEQVVEQQDASRARQQALEESLTSLYSPPYTSKSSHLFDGMQQVEEERRPPSPFPGANRTAAQEQEDPGERDLKRDFLPTFLLVVGSNLFTVGLLQFFFSSNGVLALEWDSHYWFIYCLAAVPMCYFGYRKVGW